jgi:hypothetical protein
MPFLRFVINLKEAEIELGLRAQKVFSLPSISMATLDLGDPLYALKLLIKADSAANHVGRSAHTRGPCGCEL